LPIPLGSLLGAWAIYLTVTIPPGDGVVLSDAPGAQVMISPDDGVVLSDAIDRLVLALRDGVVLSDGIVLMTFPLRDGVVLSDAPGTQVMISPGDGVALSDAPITQVMISPADRVTLSDVVSRMTFALRDVVVLGDGVAQMILSLRDGVVLSDAPVVQVTVSPGDGVVLSDAPGTRVTISPVDGVVLSDVISQVTFALHDGVVLSDVISQVTFALHDGVTLADTIAHTFVFSRVIEVQPESEDATTDLFIHVAQGDRLPHLLFVFTDADGNQQTYDESAVVTLLMRSPGAPTYKIDAVCERLENGWYLYTLAATDTDTPGEYQANLVIEIDDREMTSELFVVRIRDVITPTTPSAPVVAPDPVSPERDVALHPEAESAMPDVIVHLVEGDTLPYLLFTLTYHDDTPVKWNDDDVVILRLWSGDTYLINAQCTSLGDGRYVYVLQAADTAATGEYYAHLVVQLADGRAYTSAVFVVRIREDL
jgi:hypothetical protein